MLQRVAMDCNVLRCVAVNNSSASNTAASIDGSVLHSVAVWCRVVQCVAVWCNAVHCVAVCCGGLGCVAGCCRVL